VVDGQALNFAVPAAAVRALLVKGATGKPAPLASAGGKPLDRAATGELDAAWAAMGEERWSDAAGILTGLRSRQPDNPFVWYALGHLHFRLGNCELAVEALKTAIRLKPDFPAAYCHLGGCYLMLGRRVEAIEAYKMAIRLKPDFADAYCGLGAAYSNKELAVEAYKTAIRLQPDDADAYIGLGAAYNGCGRYVEAVGALNTAIRLKPDNAAAYLNLGSAYSGCGRYVEAVEASKTAIGLVPDFAAAYCNLGAAYVRLGNRAEALRAYQTLQGLDPAMAEELRALIDAPAPVPGASGGESAKIVYVVGRSSSMTGSIDLVNYELKRSIGNLTESKEFQIIFYSSGLPVEMPTRRLVRATERNKQLAFEFIDGGYVQSQTDPSKALERAFDYKPDLIYLLTVGEFAPAIVDLVKRLNFGGKVTVNTIGFLDKTRETVLKQIAHDNHGNYKFVSGP
jgi:tetratricopeptide (TPR) repeat protein